MRVNGRWTGGASGLDGVMQWVLLVVVLVMLVPVGWCGGVGEMRCQLSALPWNRVVGLALRFAARDGVERA